MWVIPEPPGVNPEPLDKFWFHSQALDRTGEPPDDMLEPLAPWCADEQRLYSELLTHLLTRPNPPEEAHLTIPWSPAKPHGQDPGL